MTTTSYQTHTYADLQSTPIHLTVSRWVPKTKFSEPLQTTSLLNHYWSKSSIHFAVLTTSRKQKEHRGTVTQRHKKRANIRPSPLLSPWQHLPEGELFNCQWSWQKKIKRVCYHSVSMGLENISLLRKQACTRWCHLSADKQLAFQGPKLQFVPHRKQATPVCAAKWSWGSVPHNRK